MWADFKFPPLNLWSMPPNEVIIYYNGKYYHDTMPELWEKV